MRKVMIVLVCFMMVLTIQGSRVQGVEDVFTDVPEGHWAEENINFLKEQNITSGIGGGEFGLGQPLTRAQFVTFLGKLMVWTDPLPESNSFEDIQDQTAWYYGPVERALINGVIDQRVSTFRPNDLITREEMALMIVNTLDYGWLAEEKMDEASPFTDVTDHVGYMILLNDFGIITGYGNGLFGPEDTAKREEAAAILMRMYAKLNHEFNYRNAFYRDSSYSQIDHIPSFDAVGFGWADLTYDESSDAITLSDTKPNGYEEPLELAEDNQVTKNLAVMGYDNQMAGETGEVMKLLSNEANMVSVASSIVQLVETYDYEGVVIDFEGLSGLEGAEGYKTFLSLLKDDLGDKTLSVAVQPNTYYTGYNYREIGAIADRVILMAHDYHAMNLSEEDRLNPDALLTPLAPIKDVYAALSSIVDGDRGVAKEDQHKIVLQVSMGSAQWKINNGYVTNKTPYAPSYDKIYARLSVEGSEEASIDYYSRLKSPKATYTGADGMVNHIWYEDSRSIEEKLSLAAMFGIDGLSIWRLGNIPNYQDEGLYMNILDVITREQ